MFAIVPNFVHFRRHYFFLMINTRFISIILSILLLVVDVSAQTYRQFTTSDGLSSSLINYLYQDRYGIIWIATEDGLNKYDGVKITTYRHDPDNPNSLASNYVSCIVEDALGNLVVSTYRNIQIYRHGSDDFSNVATLPSGNVMYANVSEMKLGNDGRLYGIGDMSCEIVVRDTAVQLLPMDKPYFPFRNFEKYPGNVRSVLSYGEGQVLLGTDGDGVKLYRETNNTCCNYPLNIPGMLQKLQKVHSMIRDRDGNIWFGMYQKGLVCIPQSRLMFSYMGHRMEQSDIIGPHPAMSICRSHDGGLWVGTDGDGLYYVADSVSTHYTAMIPPILNTVYEDSEGTLWMGCFGYPCYRKGKSGFQKVSQLPDNVNVFSISEDSSGRVWLGTMGNGVYYYDLDSKTFAHLDNPYLSRYINCIYTDRDGRVLAGTFNGIFDIKAQHYITGKSIVYSILVDSKGRLWSGTSEGLVLDHPDTQTIFTTADGLPSNTIFGLREDSSGRIWISTNAGLSCLNTDGNIFTNYTVSDGIQGMEFSKNASLSDPDGTLWFAGHEGITYFNPANISQIQYQITPRITALYLNNMAVTTKTTTGGRPVMDSTIYDCRKFSIAYENNSFSIELATEQLDTPEKTSYLYSLDGRPWLTIPQGSHLVSFSNLESGVHSFSFAVEYNGVRSQPLSIEIEVRPPWYASPWAKLLYILISLLIVTLVFFWLRSKEKIKVLALISHKIRTPLSLIVSPLIQLIDSDSDPERQKTYKLMLRNTQKLQHLASQATGEEPIGPIAVEGKEPEHQEIAQSRSSYHIVIAEDDDDVRNYLCEQLSQYYHVRTATNGKDALDLVFQRQPDAIISDVTMPVMDGISFCKKLKKNIQLAHIPVVLLTARADEESQLQGLGIGADAYITKPFNIKILRQNIHNLILLRQQLRNTYQGQQLQEDKLEKMEAENYDDKFMERLMNVINERISDPDLSIDEICKEVGISRTGLHRKLKEKTNQSTSIFIRNVRLKQSEKLLLETNLRITEIAEKVGFRQSSYFVSSFKDLYGMPPNEWRERKGE